MGGHSDPDVDGVSVVSVVSPGSPATRAPSPEPQWVTKWDQSISAVSL